MLITCVISSNSATIFLLLSSIPILSIHDLGIVSLVVILPEPDLLNIIFNF